MESCCMPGCKNNIKKLTKKHNLDITFHRFPRRNNILRQKWIEACGRVGWEPDCNEKVCSKHFKPSDFCQYGRTGRLRRDAVPISCVDFQGEDELRQELSSLREMLQCTQMLMNKQSKETSEMRAWSVQPAVLTPRPVPPPSEQPPAPTTDWTNEQVLKFIELYKAEPILWDSTDRYYKDRSISADTWERLRSAFSNAAQLPRITVPDLKRKRNSLMAKYKSLLNKKIRSMKPGPGARNDYHLRWFAYNAMDSFLGQNNECETNTEIKVTSGPMPDWEPLITEIKDPLITEVSDPLKTEVKSESELEQSDVELEPEQCEPVPALEQSDPVLEPEQSDPELELVCESKEMTQPLQVTPHVKEAMDKAAQNDAKQVTRTGEVRNMLSTRCRHLKLKVKSYEQLVRRRDKKINALHEEIMWLNTQISKQKTQVSNQGTQQNKIEHTTEQNKRDAPPKEVSLYKEVSTNKSQWRVTLMKHQPRISPVTRPIHASPAGFQRTSDIRQNSLVIQIDGQQNTVLQPKLVRLTDVDVIKKI